jgi:hypothetical protein
VAAALLGSRAVITYPARPKNHAVLVRLALRAAPRLPYAARCEVCGKHRYATRTTAERMLTRLHRERAPGQKTETRAYYEHGWWHLTSSEDKESR